MSRTPEREEGEFLSRAELLGGLSGRRVSSALYVIESRAAYLALKARSCSSRTPADSTGAVALRALRARYAARLSMT